MMKEVYIKAVEAWSNDNLHALSIFDPFICKAEPDFSKQSFPRKGAEVLQICKHAKESIVEPWLKLVTSTLAGIFPSVEKSHFILP